MPLVTSELLQDFINGTGMMELIIVTAPIAYKEFTIVLFLPNNGSRLFSKTSTVWVINFVDESVVVNSVACEVCCLQSDQLPSNSRSEHVSLAHTPAPPLTHRSVAHICVHINTLLLCYSIRYILLTALCHHRYSVLLSILFGQDH